MAGPSPWCACGRRTCYPLCGGGRRRDVSPAAQLVEETDVTLRPPAELARNNPALLAKVVQVLREALTPAEQQEALAPAAAGRLKKGFLERATQYVASEEELFHLLEVIRPQFALARVTFTGDSEKVYRQGHLPHRHEAP